MFTLHACCIVHCSDSVGHMTRLVLAGIEANEAGNSGHDVADWDPVTVLLHTLPTTNMRGGRPLTANFVFIVLYCIPVMTQWPHLRYYRS